MDGLSNEETLFFGCIGWLLTGVVTKLLFPQLPPLVLLLLFFLIMVLPGVILLAFLVAKRAAWWMVFTYLDVLILIIGWPVTFVDEVWRFLKKLANIH